MFTILTSHPVPHRRNEKYISHIYKCKKQPYIMKTSLILVVLLLIAVAAAGLVSNSVEEVEVADAPRGEFVNLKVLERSAGGWEVQWLVYDLPRDTSDGFDPESLRVMMNGVDITEEVKIKLVEEDPVYRLSVNRYWEPGEYNITIDVSDYGGNRAIYQSILIFT